MSIAKQYRVNERINSPQVRVINAEGEQLGIMVTAEALRMAREQGLDLVEVAPTNTPPVCRILDYGRLRYLHAKKERESRKAQKNTDLREVRFRPNISAHDLSSKVKKVRELLDGGDKVKVSVFFRGREMTHQQKGVTLLRQVAEGLKEDAKLEQAPSLEQRHLSITLAPLPHKSEGKSQSKEKVADAKAQDAQGSKSKVAGDGVGAPSEAQEDEQPQQVTEAQEGSTAVRS